MTGPRPSQARIYNRLLGGRDHLTPDRLVADELSDVMPAVGSIAIASRNFLLRAVDHLAQAGARQFLDVGCGLPVGAPVHKVARAVAPRARVVYVDNDPEVAAYARALPARRGGLGVVEGDMHDVETMLAAAADTLNLQQPVVVLMGAVLHFTEAADTILRELAERLAAGSHVVLSHAEAGHPHMEAAAQMYRRMVGPVVLRTATELGVLLKGWDLIGPGIVSAVDWEPGCEPPSARSPLPVLAAVATVPA
ncbi:SAM-dependent methyltransferase [Actinomadura sp. WMMA1423]|uniref:SAM-dependent methyltransferase n=1 Tax=Actinomadura sp. WMMA1423 TaxID=2591108 RepID=UPI00143D8A63|nr:SAM-dependent methyltransferase [Actinomadura sp. WMMA1423]